MGITPSEYQEKKQKRRKREKKRMTWASDSNSCSMKAKQRLNLRQTRPLGSLAVIHPLAPFFPLDIMVEQWQPAQNCYKQLNRTLDFSTYGVPITPGKKELLLRYIICISPSGYGAMFLRAHITSNWTGTNVLCRHLLQVSSRHAFCAADTAHHVQWICWMRHESSPSP
ncbi:hypothetical protein N657DRAFT_143807 [Parathielavia appendiculata]|uniref:Uncharacterized protein n=1 Tax=Parathielavia appendiculata TaxID=2587402 RepID=A0AAN6TUD5_9PEZI|nr:hypothetical protein N657DRAFT_143807 [Parathielavia appendiculata]